MNGTRTIRTEGRRDEQPGLAGRGRELRWLVCVTALCMSVAAANDARAETTTIVPVDAAAVELSAAFSPLALGKRTTLEFGFSFVTPSGAVPPPLTGIELHYPSNLGLGLSGLGLASC